MGTAFREQVKDIVAAFTNFVEETLSKEKLSGKAEEEKNKLKRLLDNIKDEYPALKSESDWSKEASGNAHGSSPNLYDVAAKSTAIPGSELLSQARISGYLKKKTDGLMSTKQKKKWCGVKDDTFYIYDKPADKKQRGQIDLSSATVKKHEGAKKPYGFEIISTSSGSHVFFASNDQEWKSWLRELGVEEEKGQPPIMEDEMYEEFDNPAVTPRGVAPPPSTPKAPPAVPDDDTEEIYEDDFSPQPLQPVQPPQPARPVPTPPARPASEIYDDTAADEPAQDTMDEVYDDVDVQPVAPVSPPRRPEPKGNSAPKKPLPQPPGINYENLYYALWSRNGDQPDELSFNQADIMLVRNKIFDKYSWWAAEINGRVGYVPKNFLTPVYVAVK